VEPYSVNYPSTGAFYEEITWILWQMMRAGEETNEINHDDLRRHAEESQPEAQPPAIEQLKRAFSRIPGLTAYDANKYCRETLG